MGYFPFFVDLSDQDGLIVGGGMTALRKIEKLLPYGPRLTVAAPAMIPEILEIQGIRRLWRTFSPELLENRFFVVSATDDPALNRRVSELCGQRRIPVNVVDDQDSCSFLFPALIRQGSLSIGISTGGASPSGAVYLKEQIQSVIPRDFETLLLWLGEQRTQIRLAVSEEEGRAWLCSALFHECVKLGRPLTREEMRVLWERRNKMAEEQDERSRR